MLFARVEIKVGLVGLIETLSARIGGNLTEGLMQSTSKYTYYIGCICC